MEDLDKIKELLNSDDRNNIKLGVQLSFSVLNYSFNDVIRLIYNGSDSRKKFDIYKVLFTEFDDKRKERDILNDGK